MSVPTSLPHSNGPARPSHCLSSHAVAVLCCGGCAVLWWCHAMPLAQSCWGCTVPVVLCQSHTSAVAVLCHHGYVVPKPGFFLPGVHACKPNLALLAFRYCLLQSCTSLDAGIKRAHQKEK